ncbi:MAG: hypothetical protein KAT29_12795, partial [Anaerolineales bacterium]|nr:hypothetical protein [Anaerolineales bacterium]
MKNIKLKILLGFFTLAILVLIPANSYGAGLDWIVRNEGLQGAEIKTLAVAPNGTNLLAGIYYGAGVYRSSDGADTWQRANTGIDSYEVSAATYTGDSTAFIGIWNSGVFKTTNNGGNWTDVSTGLPSSADNIKAIAASPSFNSDYTLFLASFDGVHRSSTPGVSWSSAGTALEGENVYDVVISPDYTNDGTAFAAARPDGGIFEGGVWKWTDAGGDWTKIYDGTLTDKYVESLAISPDYASDQTLFAGAQSGLFKSTNGGVSWTKVVNQSVHALAVSPNYTSDGTVFYGHLSEVNKSIDWGANWIPAYNGLPDVYIMSLVFAPDYGPSNLRLYAA